MWRLVREGVRFHGSVLLISWAFAPGIIVLITILLAIFGSAQERGQLLKVAVQIPLPILLASMIAGFIVIGTERGENRVRMQVMLPLRIGEIALARVLLPTVLMLIGLALAHTLFAVMLAVEGSPPLSPRHLTVDFIGVQFLLWLQLPQLIREIIELRRRTNWTAALAPTGVLLLAVALTVVVQLGPVESHALRAAAAAALAILLMALSATMFVRRNSFTR
jgi:hypothetical protein